jgi:hypothetical protein
MSRPPNPLRTLTLWIGAGLFLVLFAGCRTSPRAALPAPAAVTSSIAYVDPTPSSILWTTPEVEPLTRLTRSADGTYEVTRGSDDPRGPGTAVERRFQGSQDPGPWQLVTTLESTWVRGGAFEVGGTAPDAWINRFGVSLEKPTGNYGRFGAFGSYTNRRYSWSGSNPLLPASAVPFDSVHTFQVGANQFQPLSENWGAFLMVVGSWSATEMSNLNDAFSWSVSGLIGRRITPKFDVGLGLIVGRLFAEDVYIFGGPQFGWRPTEEFSVTLEGTQLDFNYMPSGSWEFGLSGAFLISRFRLGEEAPQSSQIVQDWRLPIWARARYRGIRNLDVEVRAGLDAYRVWSIEDASGENGRSYASDPAPLVGLRLIWQL